MIQYDVYTEETAFGILHSNTISRAGKWNDVAKAVKSQFPFGKFKLQTKQTVLGESGEVMNTTKCCHLLLNCNIDKTCMFVLAVNASAYSEPKHPCARMLL